MATKKNNLTNSLKKNKKTQPNINTKSIQMRNRAIQSIRPHSAKISDLIDKMDTFEKTRLSQSIQKINMLLKESACLLVSVFTIFFVVSLTTFSTNDPTLFNNIDKSSPINNLAGILGANLANLSYSLFGISAWWIVVLACVWLYNNIPIIQRLKNGINSNPNSINQTNYSLTLAYVGLGILLLASPILETIYFTDNKLNLNNILPNNAGGWIGKFIFTYTKSLLGNVGNLLMFGSFVLLGVKLLVQFSYVEVLSTIRYYAKSLIELTISQINQMANKPELPQTQTLARPAYSHLHQDELDLDNELELELDDEPMNVRDAKPFSQPQTLLPKNKPKINKSKIQFSGSKPKTEPQQQPLSFENERGNHNENSRYILPSLDILNSPNFDNIQPITQTELQNIANQITEKLKEFNINVRVIDAEVGPVITRFEIEPAPGVKGSNIVRLAKDLARVLFLPSVRVVETISGKNTMGIEVPNTIRQEVVLQEILSSPAFQNAHSKLTIAIGKDIAGNPTVSSLEKMPHLLVGGMTGSGKSVGVNAMILSILYKATPDEVRFIMIDPKMIELNKYADIPHLLCPVVTDMKEAGNALNWCVAEMEKRYRLLSHVGVSNLESYNEKIQAACKKEQPIPNPFSLNPSEPEPLETLPQIVVVIDELADLMMLEKKTVETQIARLAQKARAAGIHMIIATQRPSVDVITGLIKANIPTRIAFTVQSRIDSRTILDQMGAEDLLRYGDLLFLQPGEAEPARMQGAFVHDDEVHQVAQFWKEQSEPNYVDGLLTGEAVLSGSGQYGQSDSNRQGSDELFDKAVEFITHSRKTSISALQRFLKIGYNRAANLMQELEDNGIVSPAEHNGTRKILIPTQNSN